MDRLNFFATEPHFAAHMQPVWQALPEDRRGTFHASPAAGRGLRIPWTPTLPPLRQPVIVASYGDLKRVRGRPAVFMEHGAGQTYARAHNSYAGGRDRRHVELFLCQSDRVAAINEDAHPHARTAVIGCPYLPPARVVDRVRFAAISFHWDCSVVPETRGAFRHYAAGLAKAAADLAADGITLYGHAHPRLWPTVEPWYRRHGIEPWQDWQSLLRRIDVYAVDNSSTMYEAAAVGVGVVALNAPWFRRDVHHGLRFWSDVPGPQIDGAEGLPDAIRASIDPVWRAHAAAVAARVYQTPPIGAAAAAAAAVVEWLTSRTEQERLMADRTAHDPFAPRRKVTRRPPVVSPLEILPARKGSDVTDDGDGQTAGMTAAAAVEFIDRAQDSVEEAERAQSVWDAEVERDAGPRLTVQRRVSRVLDDVAAPDAEPSPADEDDEDSFDQSAEDSDDLSDLSDDD